MYSNSRSHRAETRNRAKDELKRVIFSVEKVRKWEKRWILLKDTTMRVYKWVPAQGHPNIPPAPKIVKVDSEASNTVNSAEEVSQDGSSVHGVSTFVANVGEDSNTGFSDRGIDSDSNMTNDPPLYNRKGNMSKPTDFSEMRDAEAKK